MCMKWKSTPAWWTFVVKWENNERKIQRRKQMAKLMIWSHLFDETSLIMLSERVSWLSTFSISSLSLFQTKRIFKEISSNVHILIIALSNLKRIHATKIFHIRKLRSLMSLVNVWIATDNRNVASTKTFSHSLSQRRIYVNYFVPFAAHLRHNISLLLSLAWKSLSHRRWT